MHSIKKIVFVTLLGSANTALLAEDCNKPTTMPCKEEMPCWPMQSIEKCFDNMHEEMQRMMNMPSMQAGTPMQEPMFKDDDTCVFISLNVAAETDCDKINIKKMTDRDHQEYLAINIPQPNNCMIDMMITKRHVEINCSTEEKKEEKGNNPSMMYSFGSSSLMHSLPDEVCFDNVNAELDKNMLTITLQKACPAKTIRVNKKQ